MDNKVLDEAVEVAQQAWRELIVKDAPSSQEAMRAALLAGMKVLLGDPVGEVVHGEGGPGGVMLRRRPGFGWHELPSGTKLYAPSLGEGDGR